MRILVTGATGFIGGNLIPKLLHQGHEVVATSRHENKAKQKDWYNSVEYIEHDIHSSSINFVKNCGNIDALIHLAWQGLPDYNALFHIEENMAADYQFIKSLIKTGVSQILVTGTCFEYGVRDGCLTEDMETQPKNNYALAKDTLRKFLQALQKELPFALQWVRLFYVYGKGQNSNSLLAQLDAAIDNHESEFNMSEGEQLRDYVTVEYTARFIMSLIEDKSLDGIFNCCSGKPISVRRLVENRIKERSSLIKLNLGHYPYPDYEAMAFWGAPNKLVRNNLNDD